MQECMTVLLFDMELAAKHNVTKSLDASASSGINPDVFVADEEAQYFMFAENA